MINKMIIREKRKKYGIWLIKIVLFHGFKMADDAGKDTT